MQQETAETIAIGALGWLAANQELLPVFLGSTGASEADLRARLQEPAFLIAVLDFVMLNDDWVVEMCDAMGLGYDQPQMARRSLPGGGEVNWT